MVSTRLDHRGKERDIGTYGSVSLVTPRVSYLIWQGTQVIRVVFATRVLEHARQRTA